jgi:hypothetical protein
MVPPRTTGSIAALLLVSPLWSAHAAAAGNALLSRDLSHRLAASNTIEPTCVILPGTQAQVDSLAERYGLRVHKRLAAGGVVEVPAGSLAALTADARLDAASGNYKLRARMDVTTAAIDADHLVSFPLHKH